MIQSLINDLFVIICTICMITMCVKTVYNFGNMSKEKQIEGLKQFLIYVCIEAERIYGASTGQLKLRYVYGVFVERFSWLAKMISFDQFSDYVDEALDTVKGMLQNNEKVKAIVESGDNNG